MLTDTEKAIADLSLKVDELLALVNSALNQSKNVAELNLIASKVQATINAFPPV